MFVGSEKDVGRHLVSEDVSEALEKKLRQAAYGIDITSLVSERDLNRLLRWIAQSGGTIGTEWVRKVADDDTVFAAILRNGLWNSEVLVSGEAARLTSVQFSWPFLAEFLGKDFLKARVQALASAVAGTDPDDELKKALELAQQHI